MQPCNQLRVPDTDICLTAGCQVKLGRFDDTTWVLQYGWFTWGGNRPFCGWYLTNLNNPTEVKPLQRPDLYDIYLIKR